MARDIVISTGDRGSGTTIGDLKLRMGDSEPAMKAIGAILVSSAQKAFREQRLGSIQWPGRYPNQEDPFVNVAGLVSDLAKGSAVAQRRTDRRPALMDTGNLAASFGQGGSVQSGKLSVVVGTTVDYAADHQWGLTSSQPVTPTVRDGLTRFIRTERGKRVKDKLGFLFAVDELETDIVERPFLGVTDEAEGDIVSTVELFIAEGDTP